VRFTKPLPGSYQIARTRKGNGTILPTRVRTETAIFCAMSLALAWGCISMPSMEQQELMIQGNTILVHQLTAPAFVHVWGKPTYHHAEYSSFFVMRDHTMVPRSRVPLGESPAGWESGMDAEEGVFFAYPDRGWLLVFVGEELVYREELKAEQLHALGKSWQHEDRFKSRLDQTTTP
jgi:hypothetical protein